GTRVVRQAISSRGIAIVPEGRRLCGGMTVEENLEIGCYTPSARSAREAGLERVYAMFPALRARRRQAAGTLSGGEQQMAAIGRALMAGPRPLLPHPPAPRPAAPVADPRRRRGAAARPARAAGAARAADG